MSDNIKRLGNIYGAKCGSGYAGNVYGINGIAPTITCIGGGQEQICPALKANYYKMRVTNFVYHKGCGDGFTAPCVIEISNAEIN